MRAELLNGTVGVGKASVLEALSDVESREPAAILERAGMDEVVVDTSDSDVEAVSRRVLQLVEA